MDTFQKIWSLYKASVRATPASHEDATNRTDAHEPLVSPVRKTEPFLSVLTLITGGLNPGEATQ